MNCEFCHNVEARYQAPDGHWMCPECMRSTLPGLIELELELSNSRKALEAEIGEQILAIKACLEPYLQDVVDNQFRHGGRVAYYVPPKVTYPVRLKEEQWLKLLDAMPHEDRVILERHLTRFIHADKREGYVAFASYMEEE